MRPGRPPTSPSLTFVSFSFFVSCRRDVSISAGFSSERVSGISYYRSQNNPGVSKRKVPASKIRVVTGSFCFMQQLLLLQMVQITAFSHSIIPQPADQRMPRAGDTGTLKNKCAMEKSETLV